MKDGRPVSEAAGNVCCGAIWLATVEGLVGSAKESIVSVAGVDTVELVVASAVFELVIKIFVL
jgi:hypothetical protein